MTFNHNLTSSPEKKLNIASSSLSYFGILMLFLLYTLFTPQANAETYSANFKNTDITEFINTVSKNLNKTAIIDPAVKGTISVRSYQTLEPERYYPFFLMGKCLGGLWFHRGQYAR